MSSIAVLTRIPNLLQELRTLLPNLTFEDVINAPGKIKESEILIADYDLLAPYINSIDSVKWVQGTWAGVEKLRSCIDFKNPPPFIITRFSGQYFSQIMTEYVLAQIINFERKFYLMHDNNKMKTWDQCGAADDRNLTELTVGILGTGTIGYQIGKVLHSLGSNILGYGRSERTDKGYLRKHFTKPHLSEFLQQSDYVINVLPNTPETEGLLNGEVLKNCSEKQTVFINIGRGNIIKETDLIHAIQQKWIRGAILDVFSEEPLHKESPLWSFPQVHITPHVAGITRASEVAALFRDNLELYKNKMPIPMTVDFDRCY